MAEMDTKLPSLSYGPYDNLVDFELANIMTRTSFSQPTLRLSPSSISQTHAYHAQQFPETNPPLKLETLDDSLFDSCYQARCQAVSPNTILQLSDFELRQTWMPPSPYAYPQTIHGGVRYFPDGTGLPILPHSVDLTRGPFHTYQYFDDGESYSPWSSSPEYTHCRPHAAMDDDENVVDDKPYARLIYEALLHAPGHRMMLREIYEWFRQNTTKPVESGSNGWQNSIRHNLSMNKAFENDRESAKGNSRKATSVWVLTEDAVKHGVQSTTRYRKTGAGKRPIGGRLPAIQRQRAGARGGRAARNSAKRRNQDCSGFSDPSSTASPSTTTYSDYGDYQSYDYHDLRPAVRSWPMTPTENRIATEEAHLFSPPTMQNGLGVGLQHNTYGEESVHVHHALLQSSRNQSITGMSGLHTD